MRFASQKRKRVPSVIIVSLIDVLLVVLIFMMVTTTAKKVESSLKLTLPTSREAKSGPSEAKPFVILVSSNFPYFFLGDKAITYDKLERELAEAVKKDPQLKVAIKADRQAPVGEFVKLIDATTAAKVGSLSIITEKQGKNER